jgi:hypothetical protein
MNVVHCTCHCCCWLQVHFDCKFKGIDAVSSRYARTLGGNRTIAEVGFQQQQQQQQPPATAAAAKATACVWV